MANIALITAGGSGTRMHQSIQKQFLTVNERPIIVYTLEAFQRHPGIDAIAVVCIEGWEQVLWAYANQFNITKLKHVVHGGCSGQESIHNGLLELQKHYSDGDVVLIHDGNRPLVSQDIISDCIVTAKRYGSAIAAIPCAEAILETEDGDVSIGSHPRERLRRTQTPHGFPLEKICSLHERALAAGITQSVAACTMMIELGEQVHFYAGSEKNIKLTTVDDLDIFKALLQSKRSDWIKA